MKASRLSHQLRVEAAAKRIREGEMVILVQQLCKSLLAVITALDLRTQSIEAKMEKLERRFLQ